MNQVVLKFGSLKIDDDGDTMIEKMWRLDAVIVALVSEHYDLPSLVTAAVWFEN